MFGSLLSSRIGRDSFDLTFESEGQYTMFVSMMKSKLAELKAIKADTGTRYVLHK